VAGDQGAVSAARTALIGAADPNRPVDIKPAIPIEATISLIYLRDPRRDDARVQAGLSAALLDPDIGLFGANVVGIGQVFYDSQIYAACRAVPGLEAVHNLSFMMRGTLPLPSHAGVARLVSFVTRSLPQPACGEHRRDPGAGNYFSIPNDGAHLTLVGSVAS
jgi:hypothetical protein